MPPFQFHPLEVLHVRSRKDLPHLGFVALLVLGIMLGVYLALQPQIFDKKAAEGGLVSLKFDPDQIQAQLAQTVESEVMIDPKGNRVTGAEINLGYDPKLISILTVENAGFLPYTLKSEDSLDGNVRLVYGSNLDNKTQLPSALIKVKFRMLGQGNSNIFVKPNSQVTISTQQENALSGFPVLSIQSQSGTSEKNNTYPNNLLQEKPTLAAPQPFVDQFREASEPKPSPEPVRVKPQFSEAYIKQLGRDIFIDPVVNLNKTLEEKMAEILESNK